MRILRHPQFLAGETDTHFLERHSAAELAAPLCDATGERLHAAAAALAAQAERSATAPVLSTIRSGWRNNPSQLQQVKFRGTHGEILVEYGWLRAGLRLAVNGEAYEAPRVDRCAPDSLQLEVAGVARTYDVQRVGETYYVDSPFGSSVLEEIPRFPVGEEESQAGSLVAPLPGVVDAVRVAVGDRVSAGDVLMVIESMKMLYPVTAPAAGRVTEIRVAKAAHVEAKTVLAVIDEGAGE